MMRRFLVLAALLASPCDAQVSNPSIYPQASALITEVIQYAVRANLSTTVIANGTTCLIMNNATLLAAVTVTLPATPFDGQRVIIASGAGITALTLNGGTINGGLASISINGYARFVYSANASAWFRTG